MTELIALLPGSFDPLTNGHLDLIHRAAGIYSKLIVAVGHNPVKEAVFPTEERVDLLRECIGDVPNISVQSYEGLTVDFAKEVNARVIVRGIRDSIDLRDELHAANINLMVGGIETVFLLASEQFALTSSTFIKQIVAMGGEESKRLSSLVPEKILDRLRHKYEQTSRKKPS